MKTLILEFAQIGFIGIKYFMFGAFASYHVDKWFPFDEHKSTAHMYVEVILQIAVLTVVYHIIADYIVPSIPSPFLFIDKCVGRCRGLFSARIVSAFSLMLYADNMKTKIDYLRKKGLHY